LCQIAQNSFSTILKWGKEADKLQEYTVKRFAKGQVVHHIRLSDEKVLDWTFNFVTFAVFGPDDKVVFATNSLTSKKSPEVYDRRITAQQVADWYNENV
jgi:phosphate-selective porin